MRAALTRVVPVATIGLFVLSVPAAALAAGGGAKCNASACKVYIEQGAPNAGGQKQVQQQQPVSPTTGGNGPSNDVARVLANAGNDKGALSQLMGTSGSGSLRPSAASVVAPSTLGAVLDLGSGPTALFAILLATALGLAIHSGVRSRRVGA